jgi:hypothetical protein
LHRLLFFRCSIHVSFSILHILSCVLLYYSLSSLPLHLILLSVFFSLCRLLRFSSFCRLFTSLAVEPLVPTWIFISAHPERQFFLGRCFL